MVAQTTQPSDRVEILLERIRRRHPKAEVIFKDTVCHPTKARQNALERLCDSAEFVMVVGGRNSNNSWQLVEKARKVSRSSELRRIIERVSLRLVRFRCWRVKSMPGIS